ncbi:MAG: PDZ domain-containing protein [Chloroflexi bacterium]|nr:MAG: PDZ domain-containing protein [Chloroflexota bacterium]
MRRLPATRILALAVVVLALAAGGVAAVAATRGGDDGPRKATAQEATATPAPAAKAWLGVSVKQSDKPAGLAIKHVVPDSPGAGAALEPGDVITAIDGQGVSKFDDLKNAVEAKAVGDEVTLSVVKNGRDHPDAQAEDIKVTLKARPAEADIKDEIGDRIGRLFDRFVDGQFRYLDENGKTVTIEVTAGTVKSVSASEITLDVNGDEGDKSFSIPEGVTVPEGLKEGDRAAVIMKDGTVQHVISGHFPFLPGLLPDGLNPFHDGGRIPKPSPQTSNSTPQA